ncbi:uncharacterized protein [Chelonus insularis]|uniref:uncharacterized protein n=1 Tax=Chelonus insularis TaxID=460826 RepID=UPI00158A6B95|nr:uncharacterized protein LOC118068282 [Chelonus insularis]
MILLRIYVVVLAALVLVCDSVAPPQIQLFDISEYVYGVDDDLQAKCRAAIEAEHHAYRTNSWKQAKWNGSTCEDTWENPCPPSEFRTPSGTCNNIRHPSWGARGSPFIKMLPPAYSDGISTPRSSVGRRALPSPMDIIARLHKMTAKEERKELTSLAGLWAELVLRDIATPITPSLDVMQCCQNSQNPECYSTHDYMDNCTPYLRAVPTRSSYNCKFEYREQMNAASSYLDGSDIYGISDDQMNRIRTYKSGQVNIAFCEICNQSDNALQYLYSLILKEHNRIARNLEHLNSHWDDAKLFLEARRAVIAQIQRITIHEFASSILGESAIGEELKESTNGFYRDYSSANRPGTFDAVALAVLPALTSLSRQASSTPLENKLNNVARGLNLDIMESRRSLRFAHNDMLHAWNISALLIHIARDHGIPGYINYLDYCNPTGGSSTRFMSQEDALLLENIYGNIHNVDLLIGGILETPNRGAAVGPTFSCLLARQLYKLKNSDRFWYENDLPPSSFTSEQLVAIKKVSLSGLLCANMKMSRIQPMAFIQSDEYLNAKIDCDSYNPLDLTAWRDNKQDNLQNKPRKMNHKADDILKGASKHTYNQRFSSNSLITPEMIKAALKKAERDLVERKRLEYNSWLQQRIADPKSPAGTAASFSKANRDALILANTSILFELATNEIINGVHGLKRRKRQAFGNSDDFFEFPSSTDLSDLLQNVDLSNITPNFKATNHEEIDCPPEEGICDPTSPYRTFTGHCNNLRNPSLGKSLTTFARLLPPVYEDGVSKPRITSVTGGLLPNPRSISTIMHPDISNLHNRYTLMVMQFAQFLDHDITMTPIHKGFAESIPSCRSCDSPQTVHPECNPFPIPVGDHFFPTINETTGERMCFPSMRSLPGQQTLGPREQVNQNTGFLDASVVYGENICIANVLRSFNGRMNITVHPNRAKDLLPQSATHSECKSPSGYCFIGGDGRASEQPALTVMHTMWVREHNRIMEGLRRVNPHWDGEKLYQETRRILSAMMQHITYNEFLPRILGWNAVTLYGLKLLPQGYYKEYSPTCNPSILTEFATAAFRIGHSLLRPHIPRMDKNYRPIDPPILLRDGFFNVDMLYRQDMIDEIIRGLVSTPMETLDQFITGEVTNHLFENRKIPFSGVDLIALNVQRARDHGIPSYNSYRALCNLKRATTFEDLSREIAPEAIARLKRIYASVDDIDLFPGGMNERPLQGGLVGPTFGCIIAIQFRQLRKCDRFWYETDDPNIRFTEAQLNEIRKNTLSKVVCENMDSHVEMQRAAFDLPSNFLNPRVPCNSMAAMDFTPWREVRHGCQIGGRNVAVGESGFPTPCTSCICTNEGTQCASLRITDCDQLLREASREAILRDEICTAQCGFALATSNQSSRQFSTSHATAFASSFSTGPSNPFSNFKLPDLSQFLG